MTLQFWEARVWPLKIALIGTWWQPLSLQNLGRPAALTHTDAHGEASSPENIKTYCTQEQRQSKANTEQYQGEKALIRHYANTLVMNGRGSFVLRYCGSGRSDGVTTRGGRNSAHTSLENFRSTATGYNNECVVKCVFSFILKSLSTCAFVLVTENAAMWSSHKHDSSRLMKASHDTLSYESTQWRKDTTPIRNPRHRFSWTIKEKKITINKSDAV